MKLKIKRYTAVAAWRWTGVEFDDLCGICRRQFDATCPECKYPGESCPLIFGTCGHAFHNHCLNTWLSGLNANNEPNTKCPMCRARFVKRQSKAEQQRMSEINEAVEEAYAALENSPSERSQEGDMRTDDDTQMTTD